MNIKNIINKHAPQQTKIVASRHHAPWYVQYFKRSKNNEEKNNKKCERKYNKSKLLKDRQFLF